MTVLHRFVAIALAFLLMAGTATAALAQDDATPDTGTPTSGTPGADGAGPVVGDAVSVYDPDSLEEIASITVESITDPFEDYGEYSAPDRGTRYVAVEYTIENLVANDSLDSPAYDLSLATTQGLLYRSTYVGLPDDTDIEELSTDAILGGESATGTLFYLLGDDEEIGGLYYTAYGSFTLLADVSGEASPAVGDTVTAYTAEGEEYAAVTISDYQDPFEDYGEYYAPERGSRIVAVTISVENLLDNDGIDFGPYDFTIQTAEGALYSSSYVEVSDDSDLTPLEDGRVGGGDSAEGTVFFVVAEDTEITGIIYQPDSGIIINVGNPQA
jgi:hypothetical protein